ncbi:penaeidin-3g [Striga asiatica]|uniref:Penaeidin-3g n=1 Tax=Striga asiatica TaxID=4170 RepID=A0A5A7RDA9_STRAF|nr:penaeidin-3g [Striga asiatica]
MVLTATGPSSQATKSGTDQHSFHGHQPDDGQISQFAGGAFQISLFLRQQPPIRRPIRVLLHEPEPTATGDIHLLAEDDLEGLAAAIPAPPPLSTALVSNPLSPPVERHVPVSCRGIVEGWRPERDELAGDLNGRKEAAAGNAIRAEELHQAARPAAGSLGIGGGGGCGGGEICKSSVFFQRSSGSVDGIKTSEAEVRSSPGKSSRDAGSRWRWRRRVAAICSEQKFAKRRWGWSEMVAGVDRKGVRGDRIYLTKKRNEKIFSSLPTRDRRTMMRDFRFAREQEKGCG